MMRTAGVAVIFLGAMAASAVVFASGGTGEYKLYWPFKGEILAYHSCGCADSCWVAEIRAARTRTVKARFRCDCESLYFSRPGALSEYVVANSCERINDSDNKFAAIRKEMTFLLRRKALE